MKQQEGFTYKAERPQLEREIEQKWGWSSDTPGALVVVLLPCWLLLAPAAVVESRARLTLLPLSVACVFLSSSAGAWAELELDTRLSNSKSRGGDGSSAKAARTAVHLSHLRSYEKMGTADVECVGGCSCEPSVLDGTHSDHTSVFIVHSVEVRGCGDCGLHRCPPQWAEVPFAGSLPAACALPP